MKTHQVVHRLAMASLAIVAGGSIIGSMYRFPSERYDFGLAPVLGLAVWSWLLWKIWKRPRKWGLGVGIFLLLLIPFQSHLWWLAIHNPSLVAITSGRSPVRFILAD